MIISEIIVNLLIIVLNNKNILNICPTQQQIFM